MLSTLRMICSFFAALVVPGAALASVQTGVPTPGALSLQPAATRIMERLHFFNDFLLVIITVVTLFVMALLLYVMLKYRQSGHPVARQFSHNTLVEVVWTLFPVLILVVIALPSFTNLYYIEQEPDLEQIVADADYDNPNVYPDAAAQGWVTVKAQGNQWNWTYQYPDYLDDEGYPVEFVSAPLHVGHGDDPAGTPARPTNLATDYAMVVPAMRYIRYQTTAADVIHAWTVPAFGVKTDAVPGKLNQGWFLVEEPGIYYGQCSELCGVNHAYMPIEVRVVPQAQYDRWIALMAERNFAAANEVVATIEPLEDTTRFAALDTLED